MSFALILLDEPSIEKQHCCEAMTAQANLVSPDGDKRIYWSPIFNEYGLISETQPEMLKISHCPFCGSVLPSSQRDAWFEALKSAGWRTWGDPIPKGFLAYDWQLG